MTDERNNKKQKRGTPPKRMIDTYCEIMFSVENVKATQVLVASLLDEVRQRKKVTDEHDFLWISKNSNPLPNFRELVTDEDLGLYGDVSLFRLALAELGLGPHEFSEKILWLQRQSDGFSCAGASVFTCTAGWAKVSPFKIKEIHAYMEKNNPWAISNEATMSDLPIEGMGRLIYDVLGTIPTVMCGIIAHEKNVGKGDWETIEEDDNLFNDEERFLKLMRIVRFASICVNSNNHWVSLICIPYGPDPAKETAFMVCDSLLHTSAMAYPSYSSLRRHFFVKKTVPTKDQPLLNKFPMTMSLYPMLQTNQDADPRTVKFMERMIRKTIESMEKEEVPIVPWKIIASLLDSLDE